MNGLIAWWAKNSIAANLLMIAIFFVGLVQYFSLERENFPSFEVNGVSVTVSWPGADPRQVEEQIVLRVEEAIADIDGIDEISSTAREGFGSVFLRINPTVDMTDMINKVKNRVDGISTLPRDAFPPIVRQAQAQDQSMLISLTGDLEQRRLFRLAKQLRDDLTTVPYSSSDIRIFGLRNEEVSIEVSEEALRRYNLTFSDVSRAIAATSINQSSGAVKTDTGNIPVAIRNLADTEKEFERIIIRQNLDGSYVRVGDVATVIDGYEDINEYGREDGKKSLLLVVVAPEDMNIVQMSVNVRKWIEQKNAELTEPVELQVWFDGRDFFDSNMNLVGGNAFVGLGLVLIILMLFLRPVVALWVAVGIAISFIGAFIFLDSVGVSLNMLSFFGLLLVIGIVVDDALIVGESIHRQTERGKEGLDAAIIGTQIVAKPVFFAVITTMIAFTPFVLLTNESSQILKHISFTIIFALIFSLVECFLILPAHLSHMKEPGKEGRFYRFQRIFADGILGVADKVYRPLVAFCVRARYLTVIFFMSLFSMSIALMSQGWIGFDFLPKVEGTFMQLDISPQEGTPFKRNLEIYQIVDQARQQLEEELNARDGVDVLERIYLEANDGGVVAFMTYVEADQRSVTMQQIAERFRELIGDIPDAEDITFDYSPNAGGSPFNVGIESDSLEELLLASEDIKAWLRARPGVYDVRDRLESTTDEIRVNLKPGAERFGLTLSQVAQQVRQAYYGEEVQRLPRDGEDVRVMVRYPKETRENLNSLNSFRIRTSDGREVPLSAVADISYAPSFNRIDRFARQRTTQVLAEFEESLDRGTFMKSFWSEFIPEWKERHPGVNLRARGASQAQQEFGQEITLLFLGALFAMYIVLAIGFNSYFQPILIMFAIPFGYMGAAFGHFFMGLDFAMFSIFGIGAASGVVVNDNLVLVDYVNRLRREGAGAFAALVEAGVARFRPIILTTVTTFIGLVPILFENSFDAAFLRPAVVALAFGVLFALFVTLLFIPAMYAVGVDIKRFYEGLWTGEPQPRFGYGESRSGSLPDVEAIERNLDDDEEGEQGQFQPAE